VVSLSRPSVVTVSSFGMQKLIENMMRRELVFMRSNKSSSAFSKSSATAGAMFNKTTHNYNQQHKSLNY